MSFFDSIGNAFSSAGNSLGSSVQEGLDAISGAFDDGGIAPGVAEAIDQGSLGTAAAAAFEAVGLIPDSEAAKQLTAGLVNAALLKPIAIKDFVEFGSAVKTANTKPVDSQYVPAPDKDKVNEAAEEHYDKGEGKTIEELLKEWLGGLPDVLVQDLPGEIEDGIHDSSYMNDPDSEVAKLPRPCTFEDLVAAFMIDVVRDAQKDAQEIMQELEDNKSEKANARLMKAGAKALESSAKVGASLLPAQAGQVAGALTDATFSAEVGKADAQLEEIKDNRQILMERLKNTMNRLQQMQQALSNVLNTMHQGAMNVIRNIK